jgi:uncharacterized damage-inducible protein DinB
MDPQPVSQYEALARYNTWMNQRLYAITADLSDEERTRDVGAFFRSVEGTLNHLLLTDRAWLGRFTDNPAIYQSLDADGQVIPVKSLADKLYGNFSVLTKERKRTDADIERWASGLTAEQLASSIRYRTTDGTEREHPLWWATTHFFNHQTHHRGQLTALLYQLGHDPGVTDLIALMFSKAKS